MPGFVIDDWAGILRVLVITPVAYAALVLVLRATGKRTLSKMNAFDLVVTVALGSALATTILSQTTALAEGIAAMTMLVLLQLVVTWLATRSERFESLIKAQPTLLVHRGRHDRAAMKAQRVTDEEILAAVRNSAHPDLDERCSVVLETDGSLSVVTGRPEDGTSSLAGVSNRPGANDSR